MESYSHFQTGSSSDVNAFTCNLTPALQHRTLEFLIGHPTGLDDEVLREQLAFIESRKTAKFLLNLFYFDEVELHCLEAQDLIDDLARRCSERLR